MNNVIWLLLYLSAAPATNCGKISSILEYETEIDQKYVERVKMEADEKISKLPYHERLIAKEMQVFYQGKIQHIVDKHPISFENEWDLVFRNMEITNDLDKQEVVRILVNFKLGSVNDVTANTPTTMSDLPAVIDDLYADEPGYIKIVNLKPQLKDVKLETWLIKNKISSLKWCHLNERSRPGFGVLYIKTVDILKTIQEFNEATATAEKFRAIAPATGEKPQVASQWTDYSILKFSV